MDRTQLALSSLLLLLAPACGTGEPGPPEPEVPALEWTGAQDAPDTLSWSTVIAGPAEPGERLRMTGRIFRPDGTPAAGALLYVYHTDSTGVYPRRGDETGNGRRHGALRGWMRTDRDGRYEFRTIRPAPYPGRDDPAHIHATVTVPGHPERWIDSYWFEGDPRITPKKRAGREGRGGPGAIVTLRRDASGTWHGERDIVLAAWPWHPAERR